MKPEAKKEEVPVDRPPVHLVAFQFATRILEPQVSMELAEGAGRCADERDSIIRPVDPVPFRHYPVGAASIRTIPNDNHRPKTLGCIPCFRPGVTSMEIVIRAMAAIQ